MIAVSPLPGLSVALSAAALVRSANDAVRHGVDGVAWRQAFRAPLLDEVGPRGLLAMGGLTFERWLDRPGWFVATSSR